MNKTALLSLTLAGSLLAVPAAATGLFQDVQDEHWFAPHVASAYELGLMEGIRPETFHPHGEVTLGSAVAMAARLHAQHHKDESVSFDRGVDGNWYDTYVDYGIENGFLNAEGGYDFNAVATRAELVALLYAALPEDAWQNINSIPNGKIPDVAMDDEYAQAIYTLYSAGVLTGSDRDHSFLPSLPISRAEAAVILSRAADVNLRVKFSLAGGSTSGGGDGTGTPPPPPFPPSEPTPDIPETPAPTPPQTPEKPEIPDGPTTPAPSPTMPPTESPDVSGHAQAILNLVNAERTENGLKPLTLDRQMVQAATVRATEIVGTFSHTRPNGSSFSTALTEAGVNFRGWGENIAWGQPTPQAVMDTWMNSSGHRANILSPSFSRLGVGAYESGGRMYWVQLFCD